MGASHACQAEACRRQCGGLKDSNETDFAKVPLTAAEERGSPNEASLLRGSEQAPTAPDGSPLSPAGGSRFAKLKHNKSGSGEQDQALLHAPVEEKETAEPIAQQLAREKQEAKEAAEAAGDAPMAASPSEAAAQAEDDGEAGKLVAKGIRKSSMGSADAGYGYKPDDANINRQGSDGGLSGGAGVFREVKRDDLGKRISITNQKAPDFPKRPRMCKLSAKAWVLLKNLFEKMDADGYNAVTKEKAAAFFDSYKHVNVEALFNEVDVDSSGTITAEEFVDFWLQVRASGYSEAQIVEELEQIAEGGTWVDWKDNRDTGGVVKSFKFPRRPLLCRLSGKVWKQIQHLFMSMSEGNQAITRQQASAWFQGAFANVSTEAMFKEVDQKNKGAIDAKDWVDFWIQVKSSGYKEDSMLEELEQLLEGGSWVDWNDDRTT